MDFNRLRELVDYNPETGRFVHLLAGQGKSIGRELKGKLMNTGYLSVWLDGKTYLYHRMVWLWHNGSLPERLDHIDRCKSNPSIENLRPTTPHLNTLNTAATNVEVNGNGFAVRVQAFGKRNYLGQFKTRAEALLAAKGFKQELINGF